MAVSDDDLAHLLRRTEFVVRPERLAYLKTLATLEEDECPPRIFSKLHDARCLGNSGPIETHLRHAGEAAVAGAGNPVLPVSPGETSILTLHLCHGLGSRDAAVCPL